MKKIYTKNGDEILVDSEWYEMLKHINWYIDSNGYPRTTQRSNGKPKTEKIHQLILEKKTGYVADHINGNRLDNRSCNLRHATVGQNAMNKVSNKNSTSKYKGVSKAWRDGKWSCVIETNGKKIHIGCFDCEIEAAKAYNTKAADLFGPFARLNDL